MADAVGVREWAGTTEDMCNPTIRTYSRTTDHDHAREPYMTLRTRAEIEGRWSAYMYRFCPTCDAADRDDEK